MAVLELPPWSRRLHLKRLAPVVVAVALLLIVLAAFLLIPPAEAAGAASLALDGASDVTPMLDGHDCPLA